MNDLALPDNPRAVAGSNHPPSSAVENCGITFRDLNAFLKEHPVFQAHDEAKVAKIHLDNAKGALDDLERERDGLVRPLNEQVKATNEAYKATRTPLERLVDELKSRLNVFIAAETARREAEAAEARRIAAEKEAAARAAEEAEKEAIANAGVGEFTDVGAAIASADDAFDDYAAANRAAQRAERDAHVKIGGGTGRALSQRTTETLVIEDAGKALRAIIKLRGALPEKLHDAIVSAARDYRKAKGELPPGITSSTTKSV